MSGGFIPPSSTAYESDEDISGDVKPAVLPEPLLKLTPRQEGRLRDHVDGRLADLERDSKTHGFGSLEALLGRLGPLLRLILQIPPVEPWSSLRTSYLLAFSGSITSYIASLPLVPQGRANDEQEAGRVMRNVIDFLNEVDRAWRVVLKGQAWVMNERSGGGQALRVDYAGVVGQTEKIRLRSIIISGRAKILAWARSYGSFPGSAIGVNGSSTPVRSMNELGDWETEVMGMWNGILDVLSGGDPDAPGSDDEAVDPEDGSA